MVAAGVFAAGFALAQARTAQVAAPVLAKRLGPVSVGGLIHELSVRPPGVRLVLRQLRIPALRPEDTPARVRIRVSGGLPEDLQPGERVRLRAVLQPPPQPAAPGAFDFARRAYFQKIGGVGFAVSRVSRAREAGDPRRAGGLWTSLQTTWARWRQAVAQRILAALPEPAGGIAAALMTGERGAIPPEIIAAMRDSGLAHLLAISGLHMGLVAGWLFFGLRAGLALVPSLALRYPIKMSWTSKNPRKPPLLKSAQEYFEEY
jgi:competence protein ComEC